MRFAMALAAVLSVSVPAARAGGFELGTVELSGSGSIVRSGNDYITQTALTLNPGAAVYLARFFNIGPIVNLSRYSTRYEEPGYSASRTTSSFWDLGGKIGFLVNWSDGFGRPLPFIDLGSGLELRSIESESESGGFMLAMGGIKLKIGECFYFALSESYTRRSISSYENLFSTGIGFSGLIGR